MSNLAFVESDFRYGLLLVGGGGSSAIAKRRLEYSRPPGYSYTLYPKEGACKIEPLGGLCPSRSEAAGQKNHTHSVGRREKTPTPKTRFSIWTLLRTPGRFTTRPLPVNSTTKMSVVRPFSVLSKDEIGP